MPHKLIIALDNLSLEEAKNKIQEISKECSEYMDRILFKVNDLLTDVGLQGIKTMIEWTRAKMMLDPKWHDIPKTLENNIQKLFDSWLWDESEYVTIHASNGYEACKAVVKKRDALWLKTKILAVTALTSLWEENTQCIFDESAKHAVLKLSWEALKAGVDGIVCSPLEVEVLREVYGEDFVLVNPWVRFEDGKHHDQKRVLSPERTIKNGSTDIVMGRPILEAKNSKEVVRRFFEEIHKKEYRWKQWDYKFEKLLYTGDWKELLSYIGAFYFRPEGGKYCRLASGLVSNAYINIGTTERNYLVMERAARELAFQIWEKNIQADIVMGAQMGSVRSSLYLAEKLGIEESVYTEKSWDNNEEMKLKRHDIDLKWKKVIISEDIVTKGSTLKKMKSMIEDAGGKVVAIACVWNRYGEDIFEEIPLISCYIPEQFELYWDKSTPEDKRWDYPLLSEGAVVSAKPKNEWDDLVASMRRN